MSANFRLAETVMLPSTTIVSYGESRRVELPAQDVDTVGPDAASFPPLANPASAVREAIAHPLEFPTLADATVPGDRVAVVIDPSVPAATSVAIGAIAALLDAGVEPACMTVVSTGAIDADSLRDGLSGVGAPEAQLEQHNPFDNDACAMVGVTKAGDALRINRTIAEADFILPVTAPATNVNGSGPASAFAGMFPAFADEQTQMRWRKSLRRGRRFAEQKAAADEAGWLLGACFAVQVVPAAGGGIAAVYAGEPRAVASSAGERGVAVWSQPTPDLADLVIATIRGDAKEQTWSHFGRALERALPVAAPGSAIAVCCELKTSPGAVVKRMIGALDYSDAERTISRNFSDDAPIALALCRALQQGPVYLQSQLADQLVEGLGMTPIGGDDELLRLVAQRGRCVVIEDAHRVELLSDHANA